MNKDQQKIKDCLIKFLELDESNEIISGIRLNGQASYLVTALRLSITETDKNKIEIRIENNSRNGYVESRQEYSLK